MHVVHRTGVPLVKAKIEVCSVDSNQPQTVSLAAMAMLATSQLSAAAPPPLFSGLRRSSTTQSFFFQSANSHIRFSSASARPSSSIVAMAGTGKFFVGGNWKCVSSLASCFPTSPIKVVNTMDFWHQQIYK
ncbi:putative triose-phosphate isomerase [Helianthus anomalus]